MRCKEGGESGTREDVKERTRRSKERKRGEGETTEGRERNGRRGR